jgi:hypothetical protein
MIKDVRFEVHTLVSVKSKNLWDIILSHPVEIYLLGSFFNPEDGCSTFIPVNFQTVQHHIVESTLPHS